MSNVNASSNNNQINSLMSDMDLGPAGSIQLMFAKLQLAQSAIAKDGAEEYMNKVKDTQAKQKECAEMIEKARALKNQAEDSGNKVSTMPDDMVKFFKDNDISIETTGSDDLHNKDEWDYNIKSLTNHQEQLGTSTQTDMVYINDFMGQYNSFLQGANKAITDASQTLSSILTR